MAVLTQNYPVHSTRILPKFSPMKKPIEKPHQRAVAVAVAAAKSNPVVGCKHPGFDDAVATTELCHKCNESPVRRICDNNCGYALCQYCAPQMPPEQRRARSSVHQVWTKPEGVVHQPRAFGAGVDTTPQPEPQPEEEHSRTTGAETKPQTNLTKRPLSRRISPSDR